ncbi:MAG: hypothetical protein A2045_04925 [Rhodocyclales bacterium GWA2_65_20]|nr:MAG: hypothetical protein A2045_04925 [Rhodocyclales bacterium GWA2_65_20]
MPEPDVHDRLNTTLPQRNPDLAPDESPATDRVRAEELLHLWPKVFEASREGIVITDRHERILSVNPAVTEITGYTPDEVVGRTPRLFSSGRHDHEFYRVMWAVLATDGYWEGEIWDRRKNGEIYPKWLAISAVYNQQNQVTHYIASFTDISERKANEERIRHIAYHDPLTGLPNRLLLRDRFEQELAHARRIDSRVELLFLDLDHFKNINDTLGHAVGDKLLCAASARLKSCLRETDIISRQGGDEFVIVLSGRGVDDNIRLIARKLLDRLNEPFEIDGHTLSMSSSIGISIFPDDGDDFETLLQKADTALYQAKGGGRGTYRYFDQHMNTAAQKRMTLENCLRGALARAELHLHYQPQVDLASGDIVGMEALLRWHSPKLGAVAPADFMPALADNGMIVAIGEWVLHEACRQARAWHGAGWPGLKVAVNLSAVQFRHGNLAAALARALAATAVDADCIELELTEAILTHDAAGALATVQHLKECGVQLSIDDFGTGRSSLADLKRFAVDRIKIDRSFVRGLPDNGADAAIVRAMIQMAHSLALGVAAEGVETEAQASFLRQAGCDLAQGYLFGRPQADLLATARLRGRGD